MNALEILLLGLGIGIGAGLSPGPLLTLVISSTLERGFGAGLRIASAPLWTDLPIIALSLLLLSRLSAGFLAGLSLAGGVVVVLVGCETAWRAGRKTPPMPDVPEPAHRDLVRGMLVNALSPHPWIGWLTVLGPQVIRLRADPGNGHAAAFVVLFYVGLVGSKAVIAWGIARSRHLLSERGSRRVSAICALMLVVLGILLFAQGLAGISRTWA